jgi:carnosine N-methyltransferase
MTSDPMPTDPSNREKELEQQHLIAIIKSFQNYGDNTRLFLESKLERNSKALKEIKADRISAVYGNMKDRLERNIALSKLNQQFLDQIIDRSSLLQQLNQQAPHLSVAEVSKTKVASTQKESMNHSKVISTLKQIYRDWTEEGKRERDRCHKPILELLDWLFPNSTNRSQTRILIPGAGLCRLAYDISKMGFYTEANEVSYHMLLASEFILNCASGNQDVIFYPWIHQYSNIPKRECQQRGYVLRPPASFPSNVTMDPNNFSVVGGDFNMTYSKRESSFDVIVTLFFIDTASNDLNSYLNVIHTILKSGGYWIQLGPLLYHHEGLEYTAEEVMDLTEAHGFEIVEFNGRGTMSTSQLGCRNGVKVIDGVYAAMPESMMHHVYHNMFFVARKQ